MGQTQGFDETPFDLLYQLFNFFLAQLSARAKAALFIYGKIMTVSDSNF